MISKNAVITTNVTMVLNEDEINALDALAGYGDQAFLDVFYKHLGEAYLKPHEKGLRSFLKSVRNEFPTHINKVNKARKLLEDKDIL